jgi:ParB family transcriptional regulator, chromosome partitioning protein
VSTDTGRPETRSADATRSGLGRGLAALIPQRTSATTGAEIPVARIVRNPYQPRTELDEADLAALVESVRRHGILQPVVVSETLDGYRLIAGERRVRAAELAGLERVPAIVRPADDHDQLELALVENLQRADLAPLEQAAAFRRLVDEFGLTHEEVAVRLGRSRSSVANTIRLLDLAAPVREALARGRITEGHARALGGLDETGQAQVLAIVLARSLSVRDTEELVRRLKDRAATRAAQPDQEPAGDPEIERIEAGLRSALGTKVRLARSRRGGRIVIEYYSDEDLSRLYERLVGAS